MIPRVGDITTSGGSSVYLVTSLSCMKTWTTVLGFLPCDIIASLMKFWSTVPLYYLVLHDSLTCTLLYLKTSWSRALVFSATAIWASLSWAWYLSRCNLRSAAVWELSTALRLCSSRACWVRLPTECVGRSNHTQHRECSTHFHLLTSFNPTGSRLSTRSQQHSGASF